MLKCGFSHIQLTAKQHGFELPGSIYTEGFCSYKGGRGAHLTPMLFKAHLSWICPFIQIC